MRRISSKLTFYYKRIFPILFFGSILLITAIPLVWGTIHGQFPPAPFFIGPAAITVIGYFIMKVFVFDLVDEVLDANDALIVKNRNQEERVPLTEIMNVGHSVLTAPPRVTLLLRRPGIFGNKVTFCAPIRFLPFAASPITDELIQRIDAARR